VQQKCEFSSNSIAKEFKMVPNKYGEFENGIEFSEVTSREISDILIIFSKV